MPFRQRALLTLENRGVEPMRCYYQVNYALDTVAEDAAYFHAQFRRFYYQAYSLAQYANLSKSATLFPNWRPEIGAMMQEEALRFLDHVLDSGGGVAEILTSTKAYVNADLAQIYGLSGTYTPRRIWHAPGAAAERSVPLTAALRHVPLARARPDPLRRPGA
jgi:hypothetical protein